MFIIYHHIIPILLQLKASQWLLNTTRLKSQALTRVCKALCDLAPAYLSTFTLNLPLHLFCFDSKASRECSSSS